MNREKKDESGNIITARGGRPKPYTKLRDYENTPFYVKTRIAG